MAVDLSNIVIGSLVQLFVTIFIGAFLLHFASKILDFKKKGFGKAFAVVIVGGIVFILVRYVFSYVLNVYPLIGIIIGLFIYWYFIKTIYDVTWVYNLFTVN